MAPKRPSPLEKPPNASSSDEEEEASSEEEEEGASGSGSGSEDEEEPTPAADKKPPSKKSNTTTANSSGSDTESGSDSDAEPEGNRRSGASNPNVKPIASKPMEETPKEKKPRSKPTASTAKPSAKRPSESEVKNSKRAKKKAPEEDVVADDGAAAPAEEDSKKSGDEKKLFQRLFSEDDEIVILKGMLDYTAKKGADPSADMNGFLDFIKKSLHTDFTKNQLSDKIRRLRKKYLNNARKGNNPTKPHEHKGFELSKKIWGVEGTSKEVEQPKSNGRTRTPQKTNEKTLASLKAELISSPEAPKESEAMEIDQNQGVSGGLNERIGLDMSLGVLGLPEYVVKQGLDLVPGTKRAELEAKWRKLHIAELELFVKRSELIGEQAKLMLEAFKSSDH